MPSEREYLMFIMDQVSALPGISYRAMMGEFLLSLHGRILGGIYDNRLLVKPTVAACARMPDAPRETPYPGAREMLLVEDVDDRDFLTDLFTAMYPQLPEPKRKK